MIEKQCPCTSRRHKRQIAAVREELKGAENLLAEARTPEAKKLAEAALQSAAEKAAALAEGA
jgi:hypothetical protein